MNTVFRISFFYFILVFAAGFALGTFRVLVLVDVVGESNAELIEMPLMVAVCAFAANFLVRRNTQKLTLVSSACVGLVALSILLLAEVGVVSFVRQVALSEYLDSRVSLAGLAYLIGLVWYAIAPPVFYLFRRR